MAQINFGLLQNGQNGFQNALAMGQQAGQAAVGFMEQRQQAQQRNALSQYAANPTREGLGALAQAAPEYAIRERGRLDQQDAAQAQQQQAQGVTLRRLLQHAGNGPEAAAQAFAAAQSQGIDVAGFPQPGSPEFEAWRQQQLFIAEALETPEGREELTAAAQEIMFSLPPEQRDVNNPAFIAAMQEHLRSGRMKTLSYQAGGGVVGYDSGNGTITPLVQPGGQAEIPPPPPGFTLEQGGGGGNVTSGFPGR